MVVFALQIAAFSGRTFLIQLDNDSHDPENPWRKSEKVRFEPHLLSNYSDGNIRILADDVAFLHSVS